MILTKDRDHASVNWSKKFLEVFQKSDDLISKMSLSISIIPYVVAREVSNLMMWVV